MQVMHFVVTISFCFALCAGAVAAGEQDVSEVGLRKVDVAGIPVQIGELGDGALTVIFVAGMGEAIGVST